MTQVDQNKQMVSEQLSNILSVNIKSFPKGFNERRFHQNCMVVYQEMKPETRAKVTPTSVVKTLMKGAFLGLDFFMKECYAIPYKDILQFQTDYKGDIKLCRQYSVKPIKDIYAKVVREGDFLEHGIVNGEARINFKPAFMFNDNNIIGAFAVVVYTDGAMAYETMSKKEIDATRNKFSKCPASPAWINAWGEMAKKTVLRRVTKMIEISFDNPEQAKAYQEGSDLKAEPIDVEAKEVVDPFKDKEKPTEEKKTLPATAPVDETDDDKILKVQTTIENHLKAIGKDGSLIFKYAVDLCNGKKLHELNLKEIIELRDKVLNGAI